VVGKIEELNCRNIIWGVMAVFELRGWGKLWKC